MADAILALITLTAMEIVLGIDNVIFIAIVAGRLPPEQQDRARKLGLAAALVTRLLLLLALTTLTQAKGEPLFYLSSLGVPASWLGSPEADGVSWRDLVFILGGAFLIGKS